VDLPPTADGNRRTSALWFTRHHRGGGDAMLHHRGLNPVVLRDWSVKMEMFTSAIALTANTSVESRKAIGSERTRTSKEAAQLAVTHWFRPQPQPSRYLALAIEPVPRPEREGGRRQKTGGRTLSDSEKRLRAKSPAPTNPLRSNLAPLLHDEQPPPTSANSGDHRVQVGQPWSARWHDRSPIYSGEARRIKPEPATDPPSSQHCVTPQLAGTGPSARPTSPKPPAAHTT
jgi:hypothetical protein